MSLSSFNNVSSHHPAEDQVMKLVSGNIYNYYITNTRIIEMDSLGANFMESLLKSIIPLEAKKRNLRQLLDKVMELPPEQATLDLETRKRMTEYVWKKFNTNLEKESQVIEQKLHLIGIRESINNKFVDRMLQELDMEINATVQEPEASNPEELLNDINQAIRQGFEHLKNEMKRESGDTRLSNRCLHRFYHQ